MFHLKSNPKHFISIIVLTNDEHSVQDSVIVPVLRIVKFAKIRIDSGGWTRNTANELNVFQIQIQIQNIFQIGDTTICEEFYKKSVIKST